MRDQARQLNIQILRALAATLVVIGHAFHDMQALKGAAEAAPTWLDRLNWGWGVDVFFVISGFIMFFTSADGFGRPGAARVFVTRRLIRIAPLYWATTTLLIAGAAVAPQLLNVPIGSGSHVLASYLFIPDLRPNGEVRPVMALGWTLNYEMFFYVFFALALLLPLRRGLAALAVAFAALVAVGQFGPWGVTQIDFWTSPLLLEFLAGAVIGALMRGGARLNPAPAVAIAVVCLALGLAGGASASAADSLLRAFRYGLPAVGLVAAGALAPNARPSRAVLALAFLGDASYALYLIHPYAIRPLRVAWQAAIGDALPSSLFVVLCLGLAIALAVGLHLGFERPATRRLNALAGAAGLLARAAGSTGSAADAAAALVASRELQSQRG